MGLTPRKITQSQLNKFEMISHKLEKFDQDDRVSLAIALRAEGMGIVYCIIFSGILFQLKHPLSGSDNMATAQ